MRKILTLLFLLLIGISDSFGQTYNMSTTSVTTCSGNFYDSGGSAGNYGNSQNLTMTFNSGTGNRLVFTFNSFAVETCCDRLYIYDGPTNAYPLIGNYTSSPGVVTSTGTSLTFVFTSDAGTTFAGWDATISCGTTALTTYNIAAGTITACSGAFYDNNGPAANYGDNLNIVETFCSGTTDFLQFSFWTNATNIASGDTLFAYDGSTTSAPLIGAYTAASRIESFTSTGTCITFRFKSNASGNASGWAGWFQCTTTPASPGVFNMSSGIRGTCGGGFYDSGGSGGNYGNSENRTMALQSSNGNRISVAFSSFAVETCCDRLYIYDGPTAAYPLIGTYTSNPGTVVSTGTSLCFVFTSDAGTTFAGWAATVSCTTPVLPVYNLTAGTITACSGAFYDNNGPATNYADNLNTVETFCSGTSDFLQFTFLTNATNIAAGDTLFAYDGSSTASPLIGAYTNGSFIESFISSGTCITFRFKSNASGNASGWAGSFQCTTTPASPGVFNMSSGIRGTCGGGFYDSGGSGGNYGNSENRTMAFQSSNGNRLSVAFTSFSVETCCDRLYIYDGPSASYPLIGVYTSNPGTITSTGTSLCFVFTSDAGTTLAGWAATISCTTAPLPVYNLTAGTVTACSGAFYDNNGPAANYSDNMNTVQTFCSGTSDFLQFTFWTNATNIAAGDTLFAYDGSSTSSPLIGAYTTGSFIESFTSSGTCITFRFKSTATGNASGWAGWFQCTTTPASAGVFNMSSGIRGTCGGGFYDSGGSGGNYGNSENRTMAFQSSNGNRLSVTFTSFSVETCCDRLYIYDGPSAAYPLIGVYTSNPGTINSTGTSLCFVFTSDASNSNTGWAATITCTTPVLTVYPLLPGSVTACSGAIYDNGGPAANYGDNLNTVQTFCSGTSDHLEFTFWTASTNLVAGDSLFIYDGSSTASPLLAVHVAGSTFESFISSGTCITFRFKSNASGNASGWAGWFQCTTATPTAGTFNMSAGIRYICSGGFYDSGGSGNNYGNSENRTQVFTSYNGERISATFTAFAVETCCDRLYVYDGPSSAYPLLGTYTSNPGTITSSGTSLCFVFTSDASTTSTGWAATMACAGPVLNSYPMSSGTVTVCSGVFYDNGGPIANYPNNENRVMTFTSASGQYLKFDFNPNHFNIPNGDSLFIYDGTSISAPLYAVLTGNTGPGALTSNTSSFTFRFKSDAATNNVGWQAWISCVSAPDPNPTVNMSGGIRYTCGGTFYDVGGAGGNYPNGENRTMTFYSNSGCGIRFDFNSFASESCCDRLYVYDGPSTASPLIATLAGSFTGPVQSTGNCLTFRFTSDASSTFAGWNATISCPNQPLANITASGPTNLCSGGTVTLTAAPNTTYSWNTGATTQSIVVNTNGSYWVTVVNATGCTATSSIVVVSVSGPPTPTVTAGGPTTFCQGGSVVLSTTSGGTLSWSNSATTSSTTVTSSGNYTVTTTDGNGCTATSSPVAVTVNPTPSPVINASGPTTFCAGGNVTLSVSGGGTYAWTNGANTSSINVTSSGTYGVDVTNAFGCTGTATPVSVSVLAAPVATISASGPTTFCQGNTVTLNAGGGSSYVWSESSTGNSLVVGSSGTYYVIASNGACTDTSSSINVTVNPTPSPVITASGPTTFCSGDSVTLSVSGSGSILWSNNAMTPSITVSTSGNYSAAVTNGFGCTGNATPVAVNVLPVPNATITPSGSTVICQGNTVTLTASGGSSYTWSDNSTASSISVGGAGTYYVIASNGSCIDTSASVTVSVNPLPNVTLNLPIDTFCTTTATVVLSGESPAGGTWSGPGVSGNTFNPAVAGQGLHTIVYTYTDANGCSNSASQTVYVDVCSGVPSQNVQTMSVFPNPTSDFVTVLLPSGSAVKTIYVYDLRGRLLIEESVQGSNKADIDLMDFESGVYLLKAGDETIRIVKQ